MMPFLSLGSYDTYLLWASMVEYADQHVDCDRHFGRPSLRDRSASPITRSKWLMSASSYTNAVGGFMPPEPYTRNGLRSLAVVALGGAEPIGYQVSANRVAALRPST